MTESVWSMDSGARYPEMFLVNKRNSEGKFGVGYKEVSKMKGDARATKLDEATYRHAESQTNRSYYVVKEERLPPPLFDPFRNMDMKKGHDVLPRKILEYNQENRQFSVAMADVRDPVWKSASELVHLCPRLVIDFMLERNKWRNGSELAFV